MVPDHERGAFGGQPVQPSHLGGEVARVTPDGRQLPEDEIRVALLGGIGAPSGDPPRQQGKHRARTSWSRLRVVGERASRLDMFPPLPTLPASGPGREESMARNSAAGRLWKRLAHRREGRCRGRLDAREPGRGKKRPDSALRPGGYLGRKLRGRVNRSAVWSVTEVEECLRWPLRGAVTAVSQHRACTARPGGEPAVRKPRTVALPAGPLAFGAAAARDPARPIQPGGRTQRRGRDQRPPDRGGPDAARGYVHALTWSSGAVAHRSAAPHPPQAGQSPPRGQRRRPGNARSCSLQQEG